VRKVCKECSEEVEAPNSIISEFDLDSSCLVKKANGCPSCNQTGYRGRKAVYDFLEASKELKDAIRQNNQVLIASLVSHSMTVQMKDSFRLMLEKQETTPEEVQRLQSS
jgi:type II secretory ATPase GspE/PulE/Tfp pilus assembly ATPase PilB-like protein